MPSGDWYRSAAWDEAAQTEFRKRLARARPSNRVQYRRVKGWVLLGSNDPRVQGAGAAMLEETALDPDALGFERTMAYSILGAHEARAGRMESAERFLRAALDGLSESRSGGSGLEYTILAEILIGRGDHDSLVEAKTLLDRNLGDPPLLVSDRFRMYVAGARVTVALGLRAEACMWAEQALRNAKATHSGLQNHPRLGLFTAEGRTIAWLEHVAVTGSDQRKK